MDGQRQRPGGRRRRRKQRDEGHAAPEPVLIAARRPNSPLPQRSPGRGMFTTTPSPAPTPNPLQREVSEASHESAGQDGSTTDRENKPAPRREARIVKLAPAAADEREKLRLRLLDRVMMSEGRGAITRAAEEYAAAGYDFPDEQAVQLQLLEHFDETRARGAILALGRLLEQQVPVKRPVLEQRLRRLEEYADEALTRDSAAALRRTLR
ncbi:MAG: hypothetical protein JW751_32615 [Polyangiaceae bacterium]|nr:hypothetical protein [Polyangiaceae bacterium]